VAELVPTDLLRKSPHARSRLPLHAQDIASILKKQGHSVIKVDSLLLAVMQQSRELLQR
jgi:hypothetical protein